jgi:hypothetical protein
MKISTTKRVASPVSEPNKPSHTPEQPNRGAQIDSVRLGFIQKLTDDPLPSGNRAAILIPTAGGVALGAAAGIIGKGLGSGAAIPGIAILGVAGAALGARIDGLGEKQGKRWTMILGGAGAAIGAAGVVAGAVGGVPGAVAGGLSLGGASFAIGHLYSHAT